MTRPHCQSISLPHFPFSTLLTKPHPKFYLENPTFNTAVLSSSSHKTVHFSTGNVHVLLTGGFMLKFKVSPGREWLRPSHMPCLPSILGCLLRLDCNPAERVLPPSRQAQLPAHHGRVELSQTPVLPSPRNLSPRGREVNNF